MIMADQATRVRGTVVGDRYPAVGRDYLDIEVHQAFAGNAARLCAHPMRRVAYRTRESVLLNVTGVFAEAGVIEDLRQIVALGTQSIRATARAALGACGRVREQVGDQSARRGRLTEFIAALQDVHEY